MLIAGNGKKDLTMAAAPFLFALFTRLIAVSVPLSCVALLSLTTGCSSYQPRSAGTFYSVPPINRSAQLDYREFGIPGQWDDTGILISHNRVKSRLLADMRLLMQFGYSTQVFKVTNQMNETEFWLVAEGFAGREDAHQAIRRMADSGLWLGELSLVSLPGNVNETRVATRQ